MSTLQLPTAKETFEYASGLFDDRETRLDQIFGLDEQPSLEYCTASELADAIAQLGITRIAMATGRRSHSIDTVLNLSRYEHHHWPHIITGDSAFKLGPPIIDIGEGSQFIAGVAVYQSMR